MTGSGFKMLHIQGGTAFEANTKQFAASVALPIVFYLSEEIMLDDECSDELLADKLHRSLVYAIGHFRQKLRDEQP